MNYQVLAKTARYYKDDKEGISTMSKIVEEMIKEEKKSIAIQILKLGKVTVDEVAKCVDLSVEEVKELASTSHRS